jgi:hypothetical protein
MIYMNRMEAEYSALFVQMLVENLGDTATDRRMIQNVKKRLNVTDINVPTGQADPDMGQSNGGMIFPRGSMVVL